MGESRRCAPNAPLDVEQILVEAQHRWLRPVEICEILHNYRNYRLTKEPPNRPPSGSLFLFDRKVVRYFRNDGHNWRKKKDGKTVKEAHERLKVGSVDVLHCYYAHGAEQENFRRRSYWLLEEELSHIVFVHYLEVKGNKESWFTSKNSYNSQTEEYGYNNHEVVSSSTSTFQPFYHKGCSQVSDTTTFNGTPASDWEDAESEYRNSSSPSIHSNVDRQPLIKIGVGSVPYPTALMSNGNYQGSFSANSSLNLRSPSHGGRHQKTRNNGLAHEIHQNHGAQTWQNLVQRNKAGYQSDSSLKLPPTQLSALSTIHGHGNELLDHIVSGITKKNTNSSDHVNGLEDIQVSDDHEQRIEKCPEDEKSDGVINSFHVDHSSFRKPLFDICPELKAASELDLDEFIGIINPCLTDQGSNPIQLELELQALIAEGGSQKSCSDNTESVEIGKNYTALRKPLLKGIHDGLQKVDSFDRWMSKELGDVAEPASHPSSETCWDNVGEDGDSGIPVQVPVEQLFSIIDFSPNWAYTDSGVKVLIMGKFLRSSEEVRKHKWACMFGEHEVPAEIISGGVLRCHTPLHANGRVPFYITCSNRLACSEVREFEFRPNVENAGCAHLDETTLHMRFGKLLSLGSSSSLTYVQSCPLESSDLCSKIIALLQDDKEWEIMLNFTNQDEQSGKDQLLQKLLKEKLQVWLIQRISEGGNGASVLDKGGQGVLHFASALGYQWAIVPTVAAGVCVDFRDVNGWTALHWAAFYGRERMVALLISLGADPGKVTHPTAKTPGRTPADLASSNGHKGIAGYLAESALSSHVSLLELDSDRSSRARETTSKWLVAPVSDGHAAHGSLKESLAAVHNATQAAARIHQVYRIQSFQRKQLREYGDTQHGDRALSLLAFKPKKTVQNFEPVHAAATRIQNKFRGWKGRKDFLLTRQRIIKIQAVVRGHQVRKRYRKIIWSVRFLDRVILRWRRKGRGLSVFKPSSDDTEDDYDFLNDGKRQSEVRLQKAVARVKSMVRYPEARDQYGRLLNAVAEMQGMMAAYEQILHTPEADLDDDLIRLDALLEDETLMEV